MPQTIVPAHMTINEFSSWARLGRTRIYELIGSGELKAIKLGMQRDNQGEATLLPFGNMSS